MRFFESFVFRYAVIAAIALALFGTISVFHLPMTALPYLYAALAAAILIRILYARRRGKNPADDSRGRRSDANEEGR